MDAERPEAGAAGPTAGAWEAAGRASRTPLVAAEPQVVVVVAAAPSGERSAVLPVQRWVQRSVEEVLPPAVGRARLLEEEEAPRAPVRATSMPACLQAALPRCDSHIPTPRADNPRSTLQNESRRTPRSKPGGTTLLSSSIDA